MQPKTRVIDGVEYVVKGGNTLENDPLGKTVKGVVDTVSWTWHLFVNTWLLFLLLAVIFFCLVGVISMFGFLFDGTVFVAFYSSVELVRETLGALVVAPRNILVNLLINASVPDGFSRFMDSYGVHVCFVIIHLITCLCNFVFFIPMWDTWASVRERVKPDSPVVTLKHNSASFVAKVLDTHGNFIGMCFRATVGGVDAIVTANHNLYGEPLITLESQFASLTVATNLFMCFPNADFAVMPYSRVSSLNMGKAKTGFVDGSINVTTTCRDQASFGVLTKLSNFFGYLQYSGSTLPGFSGTPYVMGNFVYGMHLGSLGGCNAGLALSYIDLLIEEGDTDVDPFGVVKEDTPDAILRDLEEGNKPDFMLDRDGNVRVERKGKFHKIDDSTEIGKRIKGALIAGRGNRVGRERERVPKNDAMAELLERLEKMEAKLDRKIPASFTPQVFLQAPAYQDQMGPVFEQNPVIGLRDPTPSTPVDTPPMPNLDTDGPPLTERASGARLTPIAPMVTKAAKRLERKNLIKQLLTAAASSGNGGSDRLATALCDLTSMSTDGLKKLLTELSPTSSGLQQ